MVRAIRRCLLEWLTESFDNPPRLIRSGFKSGTWRRGGGDTNQGEAAGNAVHAIGLHPLRRRRANFSLASIAISKPGGPSAKPFEQRQRGRAVAHGGT